MGVDTVAGKVNVNLALHRTTDMYRDISSSGLKAQERW